MNKWGLRITHLIRNRITTCSYPYVRLARCNSLKPVQPEKTEVTVEQEPDNIITRRRKNWKKTEELTQYLKTRPLDTVSEEEKKEIVAQIRETLPQRRGVVDAIKPFIKNYDELTEEQRKSIILDYFDKNFILFKMDLSLEELRYIQDEDYYVDIEEWLKKDLYEKQRKIDNFVIEHEQERKELLGFYENIYYKATPNKFIHEIYINRYNLNRIRASLSMGLFSVTCATILLSSINPFLPL